MEAIANRHFSPQHASGMLAGMWFRNQQPRGQTMKTRMMQLCFGGLAACSLAVASSTNVSAGNDGIVRVKSAYPIAETIERLKKDIADKGIRFFSEIDQSKLAADAGIELQPSVLLIFGN